MDWFVFLPDDILVDILKRVPDVYLRYKAKYVCKRWFNVITNRILLSHASFILRKFGNFKTRLVDIREEGEGLQLVKEQDLDIPHDGMIRCWCNEFVLMLGGNNLFVYNIITKEGSYLPQCNNAYCGGHHGCVCGVALCFDGFKGVYKVIHLFKGPPLQCEILVLGSGIVSLKWKKIQVSYINLEGKYFEGHPVLADGRYLHWDLMNSDYLISMDIVKKKIFQMKLPGSSDHFRYKYSSFVIGGKLAKIDKDSMGKAEIWILKDFQKKKWEKLHSVNFLELGRYPVSSVLCKRYIIVESICKKCLFSYDLKDGVLKELHHIGSYDQCAVLSSAPSFI